MRKKDHAKFWYEVQDIYRSGAPAAAKEMVRLALEAEDERVRSVCCGMVMDRAWGKPKDYDPDKEAPKKAPPFDPSLYTTDDLRRMQEVMVMIAERQGMMKPPGGRVTAMPRGEFDECSHMPILPRPSAR